MPRRIVVQTVDGKLVVLGGKSRSGKTAYTAQAVVKEKRVISWDPHDQWNRLPGFKKITSQRELLEAIKRPGPAKIAFLVEDHLEDRFEFFCICARSWAKHHGRCVIIAEELGDVTTAGKAAEQWGALIRITLKLGSDIYAISQRWAEADKTALGNPTEIICFSMMPMDVDYMAKRTGLDKAELAGLRKVETATTITCPYVRLVWDSNQVIRDKLVFRKKVK